MPVDTSIEKLLGNDTSLFPYIANMESHAIKADIFGDLTSDDLSEMGIESLGHRVKIMRLVRAHKDAKAPKPYVSPPSPHSQPNLSAMSSQNNSSSSLALNENHDASSKDSTQALRSRLEAYERQRKRLSDLIMRTRTDLLRKSKELEPLPTPTVKGSPATTPGISPSTMVPPSQINNQINNHRKSIQESYFVQRSGSIGSNNGANHAVHNMGNYTAPAPPTSTIPNINIGVANKLNGISFSASNSPVRPASLIPHTNGPQFGPDSTPLSTAATTTLPKLNSQRRGVDSRFVAPPQPIRTSSAPQLPTTANIAPNSQPNSGLTPVTQDSQRVQLSSNVDPFKKLRCNETDNTVAVLSSMAKIFKLEGGAKEWRLQLVHGDSARYLLDHEFPLKIYKQIQDSGTTERLTFQARHIIPSKPPTSGNFI